MDEPELKKIRRKIFRNNQMEMWKHILQFKQERNEVEVIFLCIAVSFILVKIKVLRFVQAVLLK